LRTKEFEKDYRYFPEEDLIPIELEPSFIQKVKDELPEMPQERKERFKEEYGLPEFSADIVVKDKAIGDFFEEAANFIEGFGEEEYQQICNWLMGDISRWLNDHNIGISKTKLTPKILAELVKLIEKGTLTGKIAKGFIDDLMEGKSPEIIIEETGKKRIADEERIKSIVKEVIAENPKIVKDYRENPKAIQALIGRCMAKTKGQADPEITARLMRKELKE
jgi:aspartyl-tRNA(Asn)/glutamyl-tRNA(Gln) amidotransferase subunit B